MGTDTLDDNKQDDTDDFEAGFTGDDSTERPSAPVEKPAEEVAAPKYAQITEEQWADYTARAAKIDEIKATLDKVSGTAFGKIGGIERTLQQLQGSGVGDVSAEDFAKLREEFPDLAEMVVEGLNSALKRAPKGAPDMSEFEAKFDHRLQAERTAIEQGLEIKHLTRQHKDWKTVVASTEFQAFTQSKPAEWRDQFNSTWDGDFVADAINEFKKAAAAASADTRRGRIEAAVTPRGTGGHAPASDDDAFNAGFRSG